MQIRRILVPIDFSSHGRKALETAVELAKGFDAELILLHAYHVDAPMVSPGFGEVAFPAGFLEQLRDRATQSLDALAREVGKGDVAISTVICAETPSDAIVAHAEAQAVDWIVMGTHGHTGIKHVLLGSVTERVLRTAPCPVLTVREVD